MPEQAPATERDLANAAFIRNVRIAAVISGVAGGLMVFALLGGWFDPRVDSRWKQPVQNVLILASPLVLFLVMPAVIYSFWGGGLRGAKIAVWLLILALVAFAALLAWWLMKYGL